MQGPDAAVASQGTRASSGQAAASAGSADAKIGRTSSPLSPPAVLLKNAPAVSPAKPLTALSPGAITPAMLMPDPNTYWSAVPRGQMPPPTVDEPVAQIWPDENTRHCTRFATKMFWALEKSRNPPGFDGRGLATAVDAAVILTARAATTVRRNTR